jgi:hypothetical protein
MAGTTKPKQVEIVPMTVVVKPAAARIAKRARRISIVVLTPAKHREPRVWA